MYVQEGIYDKFLAAYSAAFEAKAKVMGNPEGNGVELGPVVDEAQFKRIRDIIDSAQKEEQGTLLVGRQANNGKVSWK